MEGFTDSRPLPLASENIHAIIDHSRRVAEQGFGHGLEISDEFDPSLPPVLANRDGLIQVIINLLKNAAETATDGETRHVRLTTRYRQGVSLASGSDGQRAALPIEFCVIDDGPGAPAELVDQLFDPFVSGKRGGHGLGLALSDKLVRDMGGLIQYVRSDDPPRTIFRLLLQRGKGEE
jgi:two-component system nitrogen regulation sensor histidine kinase GlnL